MDLGFNFVSSPVNVDVVECGRILFAIILFMESFLLEVVEVDIGVLCKRSSN